MDSMSRLQEIRSLFAALASDLQSDDPKARNEVDLSVSDLNRCLNLSEVPRVRILDTALSLMCFTAPQVYDSMVDFTLKTIFTVVSSSVECKALTINKEKVLRVGGMISSSDCAHVMEACADILRKMDGHKGDLCDSLLYAVVRMAVLAPCFRQAGPSICDFGMTCDDSRTSAVTALFSHFPKDFRFGHGEVPLRLLFWHLDPMILKQDMLQILQEIIRRPFISFSKELYDRVEWRSNIICLAISPIIFNETRTLLHNWFLMTGLASVMKLQIDFTRNVLDIISRPMWWGLSMEVGLKLPFSHAYFPHEHHLFRILNGPIWQEYFQHLLDNITGSVTHTRDHLRASLKETARKMCIVDHKSMWALVMNFPSWFSFASMLLFGYNSCSERFHSGSTASSGKPYLLHGIEVSCSTAAANFIAWTLNPVDGSYQYLMVDYLVKVSELWTVKCSRTIQCDVDTRVHVKETVRSRLHDKDGINSHEANSWTICFWLREFSDMYVKHFGMKFGSTTAKTKENSSRQTPLLRRIPLGILLVHANHLSEAECSLILHYAATGTIHKSSNLSKFGQKRWKYEDAETWIEQYTKSEAIAGCTTVFDLTDVAERLSPSIFETEEDGLNFVVQLKFKSCSYLVNCIKKLLQVEIDGDHAQMQSDLLARVLRWRCSPQGNKAFPNNKDLDYIVDALDV